MPLNSILSCGISTIKNFPKPRAQLLVDGHCHGKDSMPYMVMFDRLGLIKVSPIFNS
jgi:hypothetical protein